MLGEKPKSSGVQLMFKDREKAAGAQANLTLEDMARVSAEGMRFVMQVQDRTYGTQCTSKVIMIASNTAQSYLSTDRIKHLTDMAVDTFRIMYYDMKWTLSRCVNKLVEVCFRRLDHPGTWQIDVQEGNGMYVANEKGESNVRITESLSELTPILGGPITSQG